MVTDQQVVLLRQKLMEGKSQQAAAAASGMSVRTARTWQRGRLPSERKGKRRWRTRPDPFAGVWIEEVEPLLRSDVEGALKATTILEWLDERHPDRFSVSQLRTRVASRKVLPKRSYCLTEMSPKSRRCLMMVLPKPRRHGYGRRDQHGYKDRGARSHTQPVQGGSEERQEPDA